jgi:hypothetical protein
MRLAEAPPREKASPPPTGDAVYNPRTGFRPGEEESSGSLLSPALAAVVAFGGIAGLGGLGALWVFRREDDVEPTPATTDPT